MRKKLLIGLLLVAATVVVYGQVLRFDFVGYDDPRYVTGNPVVQAGLTGDGVAWAFSTFHGANWHPLTWLSHMLDVEMFGMRPGGHHATSLVLHVINALLLLALMNRLTGRPWMAGFVAGLFALHPLHVESVAWIAERKDVLSTLFGLLAIWAYAGWVKKRGPARYASVAVLMTLSLMAKPMFVTLPLILLLLDYWPLDRLRVGADRVGQSIVTLLVEKIPLLVLSAASGVVTLVAQSRGGALASTAIVTTGLRLANALVSYVRYLAKMLWPVDLSALYPHPNHPGGTPWELWQVVGSALLLAAITALAVVWRRRRYVPVGWFWYLVTLLPVIGLVQVGLQAMADRYTYVTLIGPFIMIGWGGAEFLSRRLGPGVAARTVGATVAAAILLACAASAWVQVGHWRDSLTLYRQALKAAPAPLMHYNLANALRNAGQLDEAIFQYRRALDLEPNHVNSHVNIGVTLDLRGRTTEAVGHYRQALRLAPDDRNSHLNLGTALVTLGRHEEAIPHYRRAIELRPNAVDTPQLLNAIGVSFESLGQPEEAVRFYRRALEIAPGFTEAHENLTRVLK